MKKRMNLCTPILIVRPFITMMRKEIKIEGGFDDIKK